MYKGYGYFAMLVFALLATQLGAVSSGLAMVFISALFLAAGTLTFSLLQVPESLDAAKITQLLLLAKRDIRNSVKEIEELALVIRRDGLLVAEAHRKNLKDKKLQFLIKRSMDGFEKKQVLQWLEAQEEFQDQQFYFLQSFFDRILAVIPLVGLVGSILQLMHQPVALNTAFIPFLLGIFLQLFLQAIYQEKINEGRRRTRLYYSIMAEGIVGIMDGVTVEVIHEQLGATLGISP